MNGRRLGLLGLTIYALSIPAANWTIQHVGHPPPFPGGPHTIPVGFGLDAPSGVLWIGVALVARDVVQFELGRLVVLAAILGGAALSYAVAPVSLATASALAFGIGELADFAVYTPLAERRLWLAVAASGAVGAVIDSLVFLQLAFGSTQFWQGNTLGKLWVSLAAAPLFVIVRRNRALSRDVAG